MRKRKVDNTPSPNINREKGSIEIYPTSSGDKIILTNTEVANKVLQENEEIFRYIFENSGIGTSLVDTGGNFIKVNKAFANILEYPVDDLLKMNLRDIMQSSEIEDILKNIRLHASDTTIKPKQFEKKFVKKEGGIFWGLITIATVTDSAGKPFYLILQLQDITQRKGEELKLANFANELREMNTDKDKFFSIISHDLRNPFNSLLGISEYTAQFFDELSKQEIKEAVNNIHLSSQKVYNLLINLLEWTRIQTGKLNIEKSKLSLPELSENVLELYAETAKKKGVKLINEIKEHNSLFADRYMIETVLRNLISNSIKFTPRNGSVFLRSELANDFVIITVEDTGIGIDPENREKLFCIDEQFHAAGTENETGTGLGLILCKEFVEKNGGTITMESEPNKGSKFIFTVPLFK